MARRTGASWQGAGAPPASAAFPPPLDTTEVNHVAERLERLSGEIENSPRAAGELKGLAIRLKDVTARAEMLTLVERAEQLPAKIEAAMRRQIELKGSGLTIEDVIQLEPVEELYRLSAEFRRLVEKVGK